MKTTGTIDLSEGLVIPEEGLMKLNGQTASIQLLSANISATTNFSLEFSLDGTNWDVANEGGSDVTDSLVQSETKILSFEGDPGIFYRIKLATGSTGDVAYIIMD